jgi:hypothetical protein
MWFDGDHLELLQPFLILRDRFLEVMPGISDREEDEFFHMSDSIGKNIVWSISSASPQVGYQMQLKIYHISHIVYVG